MKLHLTILFTLLSLIAFSKQKKVSLLNGVVKLCHDGDTCTVISDGKKLKIRFAGIDTPELKQKFGVEARNFTQTLVKDKTVNLECNGKSFKRLTCTVFLNTKNINQEIVKAGWAYDSPKYSKGAYSSDESNARSKKIGLWSVANPLSPHCFRHPKYSQCKTNQSFMP
jgi:micrococcal nuclease